ncbi:hypothetical protein [Nonomuraea jabiensis]|uniref:hypothetical protein n=1 Tax=Nonomuraea jabiensis TaxID=882448 RepID=UPI003D74B6FA
MAAHIDSGAWESSRSSTSACRAGRSSGAHGSATNPAACAFSAVYMRAPSSMSSVRAGPELWGEDGTGRRTTLGRAEVVYDEGFSG